MRLTILRRYSMIILSMVLLLVACIKSQFALEIGNVVPENILSHQKAEMRIISSGSMAETYEYKYEDIVYRFAVNNKNEIIFLSTNDVNFVTAEGIRIGDSLEYVKNTTENNLIEETGWGYHIRLNSGWNAAFAVGETMTDHIPEDDAKVKWFFKR